MLPGSLTASLPLKIGQNPKRKGSSSNHYFSGARGYVKLQGCNMDGKKSKAPLTRKFIPKRVLHILGGAKFLPSAVLHNGLRKLCHECSREPFCVWIGDIPKEKGHTRHFPNHLRWKPRWLSQVPWIRILMLIVILNIPGSSKYVKFLPSGRFFGKKATLWRSRYMYMCIYKYTYIHAPYSTIVQLKTIHSTFHHHSFINVTKNTSRSVVVDCDVFFPLKNLLHPYFHDKRQWPVVVSSFFRLLPRFLGIIWFSRTHRIHVWYIYLHEWLIFMPN